MNSLSYVMKLIRKSEKRGHVKNDWLNSHYGFSFANYYNPKNTNFGDLIVFNEDIIQPEGGFPLHPHKNAEVITIILSGELEHKDSTGSSGIIKPGVLQRMSAGSGIIHSEFNPSKTKEVHLLQIWLKPKELNISPSYEEKKFSELEKNKLNLLVSGTKNDNTLYINQDAKFYMAEFTKPNKISYKLNDKKGLYLFIISGKIKILNEELTKGDSISITEEKTIDIETEEKSWFLAIELNA